MKVGMDHNIGLTDEQDIKKYIKLDLTKRSSKSGSIPYEIVRNEIVGRHMVATREIKPGETIFTEKPLSFGPSENTKPVCIGCYSSNITKDSPRCKYCGFPVCTDKCSEIPEHRDYECAILRKNNFKVDASKFTYDDEEEAYAIVSPLRLYALKEKDPERWNLAWMHMSHLEARRKSSYWKPRTQKVLNALKAASGFTDDETLHTFEVILGITLVNDFEINPFPSCDQDYGYEKKQGPSIRGLFALASMPSHNCVANSSHEFSSRKDGFAMTMKAITKIAKGDEIIHAYTEPLDPVMTRKSILSLGKFFQCQCARCTDPSELETFTSALACPKCPKNKNNAQNTNSSKKKLEENSNSGYLLSSDVNNLEADWKCCSCTFTVTSEKVATLTLKVKEESKKIDDMCFSDYNKSGIIPEGASSINKHENFIKKHENVTLHPNHVFLLDKKYTLAKMYGRMDGFTANVLSDELLRRKRKLCEEVLAVFNKIMPGRTRKRAMMMYELHVPLVMMANRAIERGPGSGVTKNDIKNDLKAGLYYLRTSLDIFKDEPEGSFEQRIVVGSRESVGQLEEWVNTICKSF